MQKVMQPDYVSWSIEKLFDLVNSKAINLDPIYQRGAVWTLQRRRGVIDSIDLGYPVPSIMLSQYELGKYNAIDGKQRIQSLVGYIQNEYTNMQNIKFKDMPESYQIMFNNKRVSVALCNGLSIEEESRIFERINRCMPLSNGELIHSYVYSNVAEIRDNLFSDESDIYKRLCAIFGPYHSSGDKRNTRVSNITGYVCGAGVGVGYITTSFNRLQPALEDSDDKFDNNKCKKILNKMTTIWENAVNTDKVIIPADWKKSMRVWKIAFINGYIIYSLLDETTTFARTSHCWRMFINAASRDPSIISRWMTSCNCKNNNLDARRLERGWVQVQHFVDHGEFKDYNESLSDNDD